jgi:protein-disulfide isomerase
MLQRTALTAGLLLLSVWLAACQPSATNGGTSPGAGETVATIDGQAISQAELDAWIKEDLFREQTENSAAAELYDLRASALERLIDERILEAEAKRRGVSTDDVLRAEREALGEITDEQVTAFYEQNGKRMGGATRDQVADRIRSFLDEQRTGEITANLRKRANITLLLEPPRVTVAADGPTLGPADAAVTIVEFSDFECPYCGRAASTVKKVHERYPTQVRVVYRHLPLESIHPNARPAAEASACADAQGKFWEFHDKIFANQRALSPADLQRYAQETGLDMAAFDTCVKERKGQAQVDADLAAAMQAAGAAGKRGLGTPAFFVNGVLISGAKPADEFYRLIDAELARLGVAPAPVAPTATPTPSEPAAGS